LISQVINLTETNFMTDKLAFFDSNILVYLIEENLPKRKQVAMLLKPHFIISTQVVAENINVCIRKFKLSKEEALDHVKGFIPKLKLVAFQPSTLEIAFMIFTKYQLSWWDSLIVSSALENNCVILYSEDMQDGLVIESKLTIVNPFK